MTSNNRERKKNNFMERIKKNILCGRKNDVSQLCSKIKKIWIVVISITHFLVRQIVIEIYRERKWYDMKKAQNFHKLQMPRVTFFLLFKVVKYVGTGRVKILTAFYTSKTNIQMYFWTQFPMPLLSKIGYLNGSLYFCLK